MVSFMVNSHVSSNVQLKIVSNNFPAHTQDLSKLRIIYSWWYWAYVVSSVDGFELTIMLSVYLSLQINVAGFPFSKLKSSC